MDYIQGKISFLNTDHMDAYQAAAVTGLMAAGAGAASEIYQFRWASTTHKAIVTRVNLSVAAAGTAFAAGTATFTLTPARVWTTAGTGGGTVTLTGDNAQKHVLMEAARVQEIRVATTAALGAGTKTLDGALMSAVLAGVPAVAGQQLVYSYDFVEPSPTYPLILSEEEGFVIRATVPATGTWTAAIVAEWYEIRNESVRH